MSVCGWRVMVSGLLLGGCASSSPSTPDSAWLQVKGQTTCEAIVPNYCLGAFGFSVGSDGRFFVGSPDGGANRTGGVTDAERARIDADVAQVQANLAAGPECEVTHTIPGISDRVDLQPTSGGVITVFDFGGTPGRTCYRGGREHAIQLHTDLAALIVKYYPHPVPV